MASSEAYNIIYYSRLQRAGMPMKTGQYGILPFIILLISLGLSLSATRTIVDLWHRRDIMKERQTELDRKTHENQTLERKLTEIQSDQYAEKVARDELGLVKEGESIVILPGAGSRAQGSAIQDKSLTNWQKWWALFF